MRSYREIQYFHPLAYLLLAALIVALAALGLAPLHDGPPAAGTVVPAVLCSVVALMVAALGRMVVQVDGQRLSIRFGWLGLVRRSFDRRRIENTRVCLFRPLREFLGWGWRFGLDGSVCYTTRGRRGIELLVDGQRHIVGSTNPRRLKSAILGEDEVEEADTTTTPKPAALKWKKRRLTPRSDWGMLRPGDFSGQSRLV